MTSATSSQVEFARRITRKDSDDRIKEKMKNLQQIGKGAGWPMYDALKQVLGERAAH